MPVFDEKLFVGPWYGEFGHEIMFVAMARAEAKKYSRTIACSYPSSAALYADFADEFVPHRFRCCGVVATATAETQPSASELACLVPPGCTRWPGVEHRGDRATVCHRYGKRRPEYEGVVVVHARNRPHVAARNWPARLWHKLAREMYRERICTQIICVGLREHAFAVEGALDLRSAPLEQQMDAMASARFAVGPSSGPMHLAQHCGCPVVVWCGGGSVERARTQARYVKNWNPFGAPGRIFQYAGWQPTYERVRDEVLALIAFLEKSE